MFQSFNNKQEKWWVTLATPLSRQFIDWNETESADFHTVIGAAKLCNYL